MALRLISSSDGDHDQAVLASSLPRILAGLSSPLPSESPSVSCHAFILRGGERAEFATLEYAALVERLVERRRAQGSSDCTTSALLVACKG